MAKPLFDIFNIVNAVKKEYREGALIIREDGTAGIHNLDGICLMGFDTLIELCQWAAEKLTEDDLVWTE